MWMLEQVFGAQMSFQIPTSLETRESGNLFSNGSWILPSYTLSVKLEKENIFNAYYMA